MMCSRWTLRLKRRRALSSDSPSCSRISANRHPHPHNLCNFRHTVLESAHARRPVDGHCELATHYPLERANILCLPSLGSLLDLKFNFLTFLQALESSARLNR